MEADHEQINQRRANVLSLARELACSGLHIDHTKIVRELEAMESFVAARRRREVHDIISTLEKLVSMAQAPAR